MSTICLNMIVKNEAHVIRRCLRSVRPFIHTWVIVDTGSTDGTQEIIREELADLPGEVIDRPWVDFGFNRSEAIALAGKRSDYLYFIDADEELSFPEGWRCPELTEEVYGIQYLYGSITYRRPSLVASRLPWRFEGVLHEYLECGHNVTTVSLEGPAVICHPEGARSLDPGKFHRDAGILAKALEAEPHNLRYRFYLAQSLRDAGDVEGALREYLCRAEAGGWEEEVYISRLNAARLMMRLGRSPAEVGRAYLEAHLARPSRQEALVDLARFHRLRNEHPAAYLYARAAAELPPSSDRLFIEPAVLWLARDEQSIAAYWTGRYAESRALCEELLADSSVPAIERKRIESNLRFAVERLQV